MPTVIQEQIKILVELQRIDSEIYHLKKELASHPLLKQQLEADFEKKKVRLKAVEEEQKAAQLKQKQREGDLGAKEEKIKKLQAQLYQLKSNKEYSAMDMEIKGLKADNSVLEEEILKLLDVVDQTKAKCAKEKTLLAVEEKKLKDTLDALALKAQGMQAELSVREEKRKAYTPHVDAKLIRQYEKILKGREGLALVPVKKSSCGGCHMELPPQRVNEIQMQDRVIVCESCARILYWPS
ncbi:MAG: hypothetical protein COT00_03765 [Candidatus Omnitrophica bacterium CG07_land_8_20_14_0_80_50_8]|nr:MAG: hypothetical protein COT00_03765 [Candidatus Omnitrophica bacterium CG07_land_8_20_14_0_80_50_8]